MIDPGRPCAWCDTIVLRRRGGWKRPDLQRISRAQALALHAVYRRGVSTREPGRRLHDNLGYSAWQSAAEAIRNAFHREGLPLRTPAEPSLFTTIEALA